MKKLSEKYEVPENLIMPFLKMNPDEETLDGLVKDLKDNLPPGSALPNPGQPGKGAAGEKTQDQRDREMYPTMFK